MNFSKYQNTLPYPQKPVKPSGVGITSVGRAEKFTGDVCRYEAEMLEYNFQAGEYHKKEHDLYEQFKQDVLIEVGLAGHPKADKVFARAWERSHSSGYEEVFNVLEDLAELVL
jgi:hypothetical protein